MKVCTCPVANVTTGLPCAVSLESSHLFSPKTCLIQVAALRMNLLFWFPLWVGGRAAWALTKGPLLTSACFFCPPFLSNVFGVHQYTLVYVRLHHVCPTNFVLFLLSNITMRKHRH
ncbi:unnamed protein product [Discosporangium mesarthrocarpum]